MNFKAKLKNSIIQNFWILDVEVGLDFEYYGLLDVDVSVGGGIHPHIQYPK